MPLAKSSIFRNHLEVRVFGSVIKQHESQLGRLNGLDKFFVITSTSWFNETPNQEPNKKKTKQKNTSIEAINFSTT